MVSTPPRFLPTLALAVLWVAVYLLWVAIRPVEPATSTGPAKATTSTTAKPASPFPFGR